MLAESVCHKLIVITRKSALTSQKDLTEKNIEKPYNSYTYFN